MPEVGKSLISITPDSTGGSGGTTPLEVNNALKGSITDGTTIDVNLQDQNGAPYTPQSSALAGNTLTVTIDNETPIEVNNAPQGDITNGSTIEVDLEDSLGNPVVPTSVVKVGNTLTIEVPTNPAPSGVILQFPNADAHTSYRTGDVGWRLQNGWFAYTPPTNPAKVAQLDLTLGINYWYRLKNPLTVAGVSSNIRFVDVNGVQTWGAANNVNQVTIDKLTGLMWVRFPRVAGGANCLWDDAIDRALAYSVVVNGVTYSDWYLPSNTELCGLVPTDIARSGIEDGITPLTIIIDQGVPATQLLWSSTTTSQSNTSRALRMETSTSRIAISFGTKTSDLYAVYMVRDARNLIS